MARCPADGERTRLAPAPYPHGARHRPVQSPAPIDRQPGLGGGLLGVDRRQRGEIPGKHAPQLAEQRDEIEGERHQHGEWPLPGRQPYLAAVPNDIAPRTPKLPAKIFEGVTEPPEARAADRVIAK